MKAIVPHALQVLEEAIITIQSLFHLMKILFPPRPKIYAILMLIQIPKRLLSKER
jgi:hypothetical protein